MKYLKQFGIILGLSFIGEILHELIPLTIPASIYGLVLMFVGLCLGIIKVKDVKETGYFLIEVMPFMFIPAAVGLIEVWENLASLLLPFTVITVVSTILVMGISGRVTQHVILRERKGK